MAPKLPDTKEIGHSIGDVKAAKRCPFCGARMMTDDIRREIFCDRCGYTVEDPIDYGGYVSEEGRGDPQKQFQTATGSEISGSINKGRNSITTDRQQACARKLRWNQRRYMRPSRGVGRCLEEAVPIIEGIISKAELKDTVQTEAVRIYKQCLKKNLLRGRSKKNAAASAVYASCRINSVTRTAKEISAASGVGEKQIKRSFRFISRMLRLRIDPTCPSEFAGRFCSELGLSIRVFARTRIMLEDAVSLGLDSGRSPPALAAAAIYVAACECGERKTQAEVAGVAGIASATVGRRAKELRDVLGSLPERAEARGGRQAIPQQEIHPRKYPAMCAGRTSKTFLPGISRPL